MKLLVFSIRLVCGLCRWVLKLVEISSSCGWKLLMVGSILLVYMLWKWKLLLLGGSRMFIRLLVSWLWCRFELGNSLVWWVL